MNCTRGFVWLGLFGFSVLSLGSGCGQAPTIPSSYKQYNAKNGAFQCDYPEGWEAQGAGKREAFHSAKFSSGSATIKITADLAGSLMGDIAESFGGLGDAGGLAEEGEDLSPVAEIHQLGKERVAEELSNYEEKEPEVVQTRLGEGRRSEFSASGAFAGRLRGYRVTFLAHNHRVTVVCMCPEGYWDRLQPVFDKVIDSLRPGTKEL
ncbi:MAG TPA: hypothetical protein EYP56_15605 [Planctomycetaceae bacterium]|nr:hypothetical protein [Planctomycetaceae bacterium]HIQ21202.1 hypothetical protein [Planctomycetota bacterium]